MIFGTLTYLAVNGHLSLIAALAKSFTTLPIGGPNVDRNLLWSLAVWGARVDPQFMQVFARHVRHRSLLDV